jgi:hypothetical protein
MGGAMFFSLDPEIYLQTKQNSIYFGTSKIIICFFSNFTKTLVENFSIE